MAETTDVLVWHKHPRQAVVHASGACRTLANSPIPGRTERYGGPVRVGWLPLADARTLCNDGTARFCAACT